MGRGIKGDDSAWSAGHKASGRTISERPGIQDPVQPECIEFLLCACFCVQGCGFGVNQALAVCLHGVHILGRKPDLESIICKGSIGYCGNVLLCVLEGCVCI